MAEGVSADLEAAEARARKAYDAAAIALVEAITAREQAEGAALGPRASKETRQ